MVRYRWYVGDARWFKNDKVKFWPGRAIEPAVIWWLRGNLWVGLWVSSTLDLAIV